MDKSQLTQVYRALQQLRITLMAAYSPEARGRSERMFRALQNRRPKELALAHLTEMASVNRFLRGQFLSRFAAQFQVLAEEPGTAFVAWSGTNLADILCVQDERLVAKDNTVHYHRQQLQIHADPYRFHSVKATVRMHEYSDRTLAVFHQTRCLARDHADGQLIETGRSQPARHCLPHGSDVPPIIDPSPHYS